MTDDLDWCYDMNLLLEVQSAVRGRKIVEVDLLAALDKQAADVIE